MSAERRRLDLSANQIIAGAMATATATAGASFLGVYGTVIGAAVMSVISTAGAALYQHFFAKTGDKLKVAGQHMNDGALRRTLVQNGPVPADRTATVGKPEANPPEKPPTVRRTLADFVDPTAVRGAAADRSDTTGEDTGGAGPAGGERSAEEPGDETGAAERTAAGDAATRSNASGSTDAETMAIAAMGGVSQVYDGRSRSPSSGEAPGRAGALLDWARGRWMVLLGSAVAVFVIVMGGVFIVEKITDQPLANTVRGTNGHGSTWSNFGGSGDGDRPGAPPTDRPASPGSTGTGAPSPEGTEQPGQTGEPTPNERTGAPQSPPDQSTPAPQDTRPPDEGTTDGRTPQHNAPPEDDDSGQGRYAPQDDPGDQPGDPGAGP